MLPTNSIYKSTSHVITPWELVVIVGLLLLIGCLGGLCLYPLIFTCM